MPSIPRDAPDLERTCAIFIFSAEKRGRDAVGHDASADQSLKALGLRQHRGYSTKLLRIFHEIALAELGRLS
jgi:hypothetical protein